MRPEGCDTVFVGNLPFDVDEQLLRDTFVVVGTVRRVKLDRQDDSHKSFAHVQFTDGDATDGAVKLTGINVNGSIIRVDYATAKTKPIAANSVTDFGGEEEAAAAAVVVEPPPKPLRLLVCASSNKAVSGNKIISYLSF